MTTTTANPVNPATYVPPAATSTSATAAGAATPVSAPNALSSLSGNFTNFLNLLMTQLKNQDPTAPMDTNQFTTELVQFTSVQQQITTNSSLTQLIQATQGSNLLQASSLVGQTVQVAGDQMPVQNGRGSLAYTASGTQPVNVGVYNASGTLVSASTITPAVAGPNTWTWNGRDSNGTPQPDGAYKIVVQNLDGTALPFTPQGKVTGIQRAGTALNVQLGPLSVDLNTIQSIAPTPP